MSPSAYAAFVGVSPRAVFNWQREGFPVRILRHAALTRLGYVRNRNSMRFVVNFVAGCPGDVQRAAYLLGVPSQVVRNYTRTKRRRALPLEYATRWPELCYTPPGCPYDEGSVDDYELFRFSDWVMRNAYPILRELAILHPESPPSTLTLLFAARHGHQHEDWCRDHFARIHGEAPESSTGGAQ